MNIEEVLTKGVDKIFPNKKDLAKLMEKRTIKIYEGFDPTGIQLHIGHAVGLRKLRQFQDLGHKVIFLIGDFTAMIGDPTGKLSSRKILDKEEVLDNAKAYKKQAGKILRFEGENPVEIKYNSEWLSKMSAIDFLKLSHNLTYSQIIERDMFQDRIKHGQDVFMNEFLYPFMQAYDSVAMDVDLEIGGVDQTFNMLMGRKLMRNILRKDKFVLTTPLLTDSKGVKIGKTEGNVIGLADPPDEFYGKIMSLNDEAIIPCFSLLTDIPFHEIKTMEKQIKTGENPIKFKKLLAFTLTKWLNSGMSAQEAQENFEKTIQGNETPTEMPNFDLSSLPKNFTIIDLLEKSKMVASRGEGRRLIDQKAVSINQLPIINYQFSIKDVKSGSIIKIGKRKWLKCN